MGSSITVQAYQDRYGPKLDGKTARERPPVICPACEEELHTVGENIALVDAVWAHKPSPFTTCPIKLGGTSRYALLTPRTPDHARAEALRARFFENWRAHWSYARSFAKFADIEAFSAFIDHADRSNLWAYATIEEWQLPYTFLSMCEFPPPAGRAAVLRRDWYRFRFDSKLRSLEDLWIRVIPDLRLLRLVYRTPRRGVPTITHYLDYKSFTLDSSWMASHVAATPHDFAVRHMHTAFPLELGPSPV